MTNTQSTAAAPRPVRAGRSLRRIPLGVRLRWRWFRFRLRIHRAAVDFR